MSLVLPFFQVAFSLVVFSSEKIVLIGVALGSFVFRQLGLALMGFFLFFPQLRLALRGSYFFCSKDLVVCPTQFLDPRFLGCPLPLPLGLCLQAGFPASVPWVTVPSPLPLACLWACLDFGFLHDIPDLGFLACLEFAFSLPLAFL